MREAVRPARRLAAVPRYLFAELSRKEAEARARGVDVISFGIGDPDLPSPEPVVERLVEEARRAENHHYPDYDGLASFRSAMAGYYARRFGVELDPAREVMTVIGSKEGISHLVWAMADPGDVVLVPDPAYPVYATQAILAGARPVTMPLAAERGFLPDLDAIRPEDLERAKLMFVNYPNNPTGATADRSDYERIVDFCRRHAIVVASDLAYVEMTFDGYVAPSILEVDGAREVAVEFYSLSKPFNMTGWRIAAAVGNHEVLRALGIVKTNTDSGQWNAIQRAAETALTRSPEVFFARMNQVYRQRRDRMVQGLRAAGFQVAPPRGSFYLWVQVPPGHTDLTLATRLLEEAGVVVAPGSAYGPGGADFIRFALTLDDSRLEEGLRRIRSLNLAHSGSGSAIR